MKPTAEERCEYNPVRKQAAETPEAAGDCPREAVLSVGADGKWHLCRECAALPEFARMRRRVELHPDLTPARK